MTPTATPQCKAKGGGKATIVTPRDTLPPALRSHVYAYLDPLDFDDYASLARLTRVSKADRALALPFRHSHIAIYDQRTPLYRVLAGLPAPAESYYQPVAAREAMKADGRLGDQQWSDTVDRATNRAYAFYKTRPDLALLPKALVFHGAFYAERAATVVERFLRICPNINSVRFVASVPPPSFKYRLEMENNPEEHENFDAWSALTGCQNRLRSLAVERGKERHLDRVVATIGHFASLKHLTFSTSAEDAGFDLEYDEQLQPPSFRLTSLDLNALTQPALFKYFVSTSSCTLTSLSIAVHRNPFDLASLPALRELAIVYAREGVVADTLATSPSSVRSVELRFDHMVAGDSTFRCPDSDWEDADEEECRWDSDEPDCPYDEFLRRREEQFTRRIERKVKAEEANSLTNILDHVPGQITRLSLAFYLIVESDPYRNDDEEDQHGIVLEHLADKEWCPNLVQLDVADQRKEERGWMEARATREEKKQWTAARNLLKKACKKRKIGLGGGGESWTDLLRDEGKLPRSRW
ncbi:hypothetical protein JCM11251_007717 [Rhodosporidiobolus azoricus]